MRPAMNVVTEPSANPPGDTPPATQANETPRVGQLIGDRYRLEQPLERGAMGSIWRAEHVRLKAPVAVKFLEAALISDPEMRDRFTQEARSAAAVRSAHVVQVLDYGSEGGVPYIAMELLEGENLDMRLGRCGRLAPDQLCKIFSEIARGIGKAHAMGVVHRDLKPGNIFLAREGDHEVTKLVDFGIAKVKADAIKLSQIVGTQLGTLLGTPQYMSPEQLRGSENVDYRTDLWALAIIACECLTARYPFPGTSIGDLTVQICTEKPLAPSSLGPVPPGFDQWFFKATRKAPNKRFESAEQMARALSKLLAAAESSIPLVAGAKRAPRLPTRTRAQRAYARVVEHGEVLRHQLRSMLAWLLDHARAAVARVRWRLLPLVEALPPRLRIPPLSRPASFAALGVVVLCVAIVIRAVDGSPSSAASSKKDLATAALALPAPDKQVPSTNPGSSRPPSEQVVMAALPAENAPNPPPTETLSPEPAPEPPSTKPRAPARRSRPVPKAAPPADAVAEAAARLLRAPAESTPAARPQAPARAPAARSERPEPPAPSEKPAPSATPKPAAVTGERHPFEDRL